MTPNTTRGHSLQLVEQRFASFRSGVSKPSLNVANRSEEIERLGARLPVT